MPRKQRAIIKLNTGDRVEITSQGELEIMILENQSQRRRRSRRGNRTQQKQNRNYLCKSNEQSQTTEPQLVQKTKCSEKPNHKQEQPQSQRPVQPLRSQPQPQQPGFKTQQRLSGRYTQSVEGLKQQSIDEATQERSEYRERLERILNVAQVKSSQRELKKPEYNPAQHQQEKSQAEAEQPHRGRPQPQSKPQSRQEHQRPYTKPVKRQIDERLSQQGFQSQYFMDVPQSHSASVQPLQQLPHAHSEPQLPRYVPAQYHQKPNIQPQKLPHPPQVQSREPFSFPQSVNAPSSPQNLPDRSFQTLFPWTVGVHVDSPRQQYPQSQSQKRQEKQQHQQHSSHDTGSQKSVQYVLDSCHSPLVSAQLGPGKPPSEPDTDYEQLNFEGSRSPSIVSLSSDSDESIVIIGKWKATEGDGSWW